MSEMKIVPLLLGAETDLSSEGQGYRRQAKDWTAHLDGHRRTLDGV